MGDKKKKDKKTDKLPRGKQREEDLNTLTGGLVTSRKKFFSPQLLLLPIFILKVSYLKRALAGELEVAAEKEALGQKSREDDRG